MMRVLLLAAGKGERMRPLTEHTPKPLLEAGGRALIEHHLSRLAAAGFDVVVVNLARHGDLVRDRLGDGSTYGITITYSDEGDEPLDSAGGIRHALPLLGEAPFVVINADVWTDYPFARLALPVGCLAHLVLVPNPAHNPGGDFMFGETGGKLTFSGIGVYSPALFAGLAPGERALAPVLHEAVARGQVSMERWDGEWMDIGTPERLEALTRMLGG